MLGWDASSLAWTGNLPVFEVAMQFVYNQMEENAVLRVNAKQVLKKGGSEHPACYVERVMISSGLSIMLQPTRSSIGMAFASKPKKFKAYLRGHSGVLTSTLLVSDQSRTYYLIEKSNIEDSEVWSGVFSILNFKLVTKGLYRAITEKIELLGFEGGFTEVLGLYSYDGGAYTHLIANLIVENPDFNRSVPSPTDSSQLMVWQSLEWIKEQPDESLSTDLLFLKYEK